MRCPSHKDIEVLCMWFSSGWLALTNRRSSSANHCRLFEESKMVTRRTYHVTPQRPLLFCNTQKKSLTTSRLPRISDPASAFIPRISSFCRDLLSGPALQLRSTQCLRCEACRPRCAFSSSERAISMILNHSGHHASSSTPIVQKTCRCTDRGKPNSTQSLSAGTTGLQNRFILFLICETFLKMRRAGSILGS